MRHCRPVGRVAPSFHTSVRGALPHKFNGGRHHKFPNCQAAARNGARRDVGQGSDTSGGASTTAAPSAVRKGLIARMAFFEAAGWLAHWPPRGTLASAISISTAARSALHLCQRPHRLGRPDLRRMATGDRPSPTLRPSPGCCAGCPDDAGRRIRSAGWRPRKQTPSHRSLPDRSILVWSAA